MEAKPMLFLTGAEMHPTTVRQRYGDATFIARGQLTVNALPVDPAFALHVDGDGAWGILISSGIADVTGARATARSDDGREFIVLLPGDRLLDGDPDATLAAARYWELPPAYVARLMTARQRQEEAPRDDAVTDQDGPPC